MQKINYSTKAQTSPLLTFVLLISFCSVLHSISSVSLGKKKIHKCKYIYIHPDFHLSIQKQMYSFSVCPERVTGPQMPRFIPHYIVFYSYSSVKAGLLKEGPIKNKIFKVMSILSSNISFVTVVRVIDLSSFFGPLRGPCEHQNLEQRESSGLKSSTISKRTFSRGGNRAERSSSTSSRPAAYLCRGCSAGRYLGAQGRQAAAPSSPRWRPFCPVWIYTGEE